MEVDSLDQETVILLPNDFLMVQPKDMTLFTITKSALENASLPMTGIRMKFSMKRKITSEMMTMYFPTFLLMMITYATTFFKPFFFEAALSVNLTTMLVMTTIFISKMESLPPTSDIILRKNVCTGGGYPILHVAHEDGGHYQHGGQVHTQGCLEEEWLEEGGGKGDEHEEEGGEIGRHHLTHDLPFHRDRHTDSLSGVTCIDEVVISDSEKCHIQWLFHNHIGGEQNDTLLVSAPNAHFDRTFLSNFFDDSSWIFYLSIKRVSLQLIDTLELVSVALSHDQTVLPSLEELCLIKDLISTSGEVSFLVDVDIGAPLNAATKSGCFLLVSVKVDHQGKPDSVDLIHRKGIEVRLWLQVVVSCSVLLPLEADLELELDGMVFFFNCDNFVQGQ